MSSPYVTPEEVADQLKVTSKTVRSWLRSGDLVGIKVGKSWRIHEQDLTRYLDGQRLEVLISRARSKHPGMAWTEGACVECGTAMPVPEKGMNHWVCSQECKTENDKKAEAVVGYGTAEYVGCCATVVPHY